LFSINNHAWLKRRGVQQPKNQRENAEEEGEEEKWSRGVAEF